MNWQETEKGVPECNGKSQLINQLWWILLTIQTVGDDVKLTIISRDIQNISLTELCKYATRQSFYDSFFASNDH